MEQAVQGTEQAQQSNASGHAAEAATRGTQTKRSLSGMSYAEQVASLRPGGPIERSTTPVHLSRAGGGGGAGVEAFTSATQGPASVVPFRAEMEQSFGQGFGNVKAHLGRGAEMESLGAEAAASGESVAFASASPSKALVAHELAHVVQARNGAAGSGSGIAPDNSKNEAEADAAASQAAAGGRVDVCDRQQSWLNLSRTEPPPGDEALAVPNRHPEWPKFRDGAASIGIGQARALELWTLIIEGIRDGKPDNYELVADELFPYMQVPKGKMALWSGGIGVSDYAVSKGKQTLEAQKFYKLTDGLKLYKDWDKVRPVWAALSARFVSQCQGEVHCYLRAYSTTSIFGEVEHNILLSLGSKVSIKYHALSGPDEDIRELDADGNALGRGADHVLPTLDATAKALELAAAKAATRTGTL